MTARARTRRRARRLIRRSVRSPLARAARGQHPFPRPRLRFALAGNQNCGKTTLFNQLTTNQHVGNFPGVTVDRKDGQIKGHANATITDLPGIYSLSPYTSEEVVSRQFILEEQPDAIIDIVDATNIERNLYLTLQLMELDRPMVLALNMMDELTEERRHGGRERARGSARHTRWCPSRRRRTRARASSPSTRCTWRVIASTLAGSTSARRTVRTAVRSTAASTASAT